MYLFILGRHGSVDIGLYPVRIHVYRLIVAIIILIPYNQTTLKVRL